MQLSLSVEIMHDEQMIKSPDKIYFTNNYLQIVQLTANSHHKLFRVACTDADVLTRRMSPFTVKNKLTNHQKENKKNFTVSTMQSVSVKQICKNDNPNNIFIQFSNFSGFLIQGNSCSLSEWTSDRTWKNLEFHFALWTSSLLSLWKCSTKLKFEGNWNNMHKCLVEKLFEMCRGVWASHMKQLVIWLASTSKYLVFSPMWRKDMLQVFK